MSIWLRQRLAIWTGAAILGGALWWNVGALRAQTSSKSEKPRQKLTRDRAAKMFATVMSNISNDEATNENYALLLASASLESHKKLGNGMAYLANAMSKQWKRPQHIVRIENQNDKTAVVVVEPLPDAHPLVLIKEDGGGWGVDLIETYAKWNNLQGVAKAQAIYQLTDYAMDELGQDEISRRKLCQSNLKAIRLALRQYEQDWDEKLPSAQSWNKEALRLYIKSEGVFRCPTLSKVQSYGYAFNSKFSNQATFQSNEPSKTGLLYETTVLKPNAYGTGENLAFRHQNGANYAFADGHVKWFRKTAIPSFKLKP